jgi:hypothetical protein
VAQQTPVGVRVRSEEQQEIRHVFLKAAEVIMEGIGRRPFAVREDVIALLVWPNTAIGSLNRFPSN